MCVPHPPPLNCMYMYYLNESTFTVTSYLVSLKVITIKVGNQICFYVFNVNLNGTLFSIAA